MRILIAPDKFKGSMSAGTVAEVLRQSLAGKGLEICKMPIADGGEGTTEVLCKVLNGELLEIEVQDPLGNPVIAKYGIAGELAIMEMSEASGLWRLSGKSLDPWRSSTYGTGQLIVDALVNHGVKEIIIGIGGSATNDGGSGMARALGYRFLDVNGIELEVFPSQLRNLYRIHRPAGFEMPCIRVACDVENPLLGELGASQVYGPQKGVLPEDLDAFDGALRKLSHVVESDLQIDPEIKNLPGAGAAGGLGFGLMAFLNAGLEPGFQLVADTIGLEAAIKACDVVITGEGKLDRQTLNGKGPHGVAKLAGKLGKKVIAVVGDWDGSSEVSAVFDRIVPLRDSGFPLEKCIQEGAKALSSPRIVKKIEVFLRN